MDSRQLSQEARQYIKDHKKELCDNFASVKKFPPVINPIAYFMAGSPGAGKTEYSKSFITLLEEQEPNRKIVRIDADEIRDFLPQYDHIHAYRVQSAAALGVEKVFDHVLKYNQDFLLDATFAHYDISYKNVSRCLHAKRKVGIVYLYQDPLLAWDFTKKREILEGRKIPKKLFIEAFLSAKDTVNKIKAEFGEQVELTLIIKDFEQKVKKTYFNIDNVDSYIKNVYNIELLEKELKE